MSDRPERGHTRFSTSLFLFRRDLRLEDNMALNAARAESGRVLTAFVLDPRQLEPHPYQSRRALSFMRKSLDDLQQQVQANGGRLYLFHDHPEHVVELVHRRHRIEAVYLNRDYTPFSRQRDEAIHQRCRERGIAFRSYDDALLNPPEQALKTDGEPYRVFTPFHKRMHQNPVALPQPLAAGQWLTDASHDASDRLASLHQNHDNDLRGGRKAALAQLDALPRCRDYSKQRDIPALDATSHLSVYLKFGCCSIREAYHAVAFALGPDHALLRQLYWRDFFSHIAFHYPHVFGHAFHRVYDAIAWRNDKERFQRWADGCTGFPIVDAGMRQLAATGMMHNRVRMIVASFLVKDLHISWRWGERFFAQHLLDYDPCLNNGNWQWAASTGCDAQPYFRIFNPWLQQQRFDPQCEYIKRWLPELADLSPAAIQHWHKTPLAGGYPAPMLDHAISSQHAKILFQSVTEQSS